MLIKVCRCSTLTFLAGFLLACAPHFYDGEFARIASSEALGVVRSERVYGDCYRLFSPVPVVYLVERDAYTISIVHGMRYWPEFFLSAVAQDGTPMNLAGSGIHPVIAPGGGDVRRLQDRRGAVVTHRVRIDSLSEPALRFSVLDSTGMVTGSEEFQLVTESVSCMEIDSL